MKTVLITAFQAILFVYGGDYKRGTRLLTKLLARENCVGLWRSVSRFYLAKFMKETNDKKLESLFDKRDTRDNLYDFTKKTVL